MGKLVPYIKSYKPAMVPIPARLTGKWRIVWSRHLEDTRLEVECQGILKDEWVDEYLIELKEDTQ